MPLTLSCSWEMRRAIWALTYRKCEPVDIGHYAEVFGLDEDETIALFFEAAISMGLRLVVAQKDAVRH